MINLPPGFTIIDQEELAQLRADLERVAGERDEALQRLNAWREGNASITKRAQGLAAENRVLLEAYSNIVAGEDDLSWMPPLTAAEVERVKRLEAVAEATIKHLGKGRFLGLFRNEEDAARAYNEAALQTFGEYAWLNVVGLDAKGGEGYDRNERSARGGSDGHSGPVVYP